MRKRIVITPQVRADWRECFKIDGGNEQVKSRYGDCEIVFPHAIYQLTNKEYDLQVSRASGDSMDYILVNGVGYAVGLSAERNYIITTRSGRVKYTKDYYGVLFASAIARTFIDNPEKLSTGIEVIASHAPVDAHYAGMLREALKGDWDITVKKTRLRFRVHKVHTYDEPLGGAINAMFEDDGVTLSSPIYESPYTRILVVDIGGGTFSMMPIVEGVPDYHNTISQPFGIKDVMGSFKSEIMTSYRDFFAATRDISPDAIRRTIRAGYWVGGGNNDPARMPCYEERERAAAALINQVHSAYLSRYRGGTETDVILLTGGGSGLLEDMLRQVLHHDAVYLSGPHHSIHLANIRGAAKLELSEINT